MRRRPLYTILGDGADDTGICGARAYVCLARMLGNMGGAEWEPVVFRQPFLPLFDQ